MVKLIPTVTVPNALDTIELYKDLFSAKLLSRVPFNAQMGSNLGLPEDFDYEHSTMHAELDFGNGAILYLSDRHADSSQGSLPIEIYVELDSKAQVESIWQKVQDRAFNVLLPMQKTFFGSWYLRFVDSDGTPWQVAFPESPQPGAPAEKPAKAAGKKAAKGAKKAKK
jgi:uncharacterized glyoxalase superfamily protein PhnB